MNLKLIEVNELEFNTILLRKVYLNNQLKGYIYFNYYSEDIDKEYCEINIELEVNGFLNIDNYYIKKLTKIKTNNYIYGSDKIEIKKYELNDIDSEFFISQEFYVNNDLFAFIEKDIKHLT
jgi:hypothetical protein